MRPHRSDLAHADFEADYFDNVPCQHCRLSRETRFQYGKYCFQCQSCARINEGEITFEHLLAFPSGMDQVCSIIFQNTIREEVDQENLRIISDLSWPRG